MPNGRIEQSGANPNPQSRPHIRKPLTVNNYLLFGITMLILACILLATTFVGGLEYNSIYMIALCLFSTAFLAFFPVDVEVKWQFVRATGSIAVFGLLVWWLVPPSSENVPRRIAAIEAEKAQTVAEATRLKAEVVDVKRDQERAIEKLKAQHSAEIARIEQQLIATLAAMKGQQDRAIEEIKQQQALTVAVIQQHRDRMQVCIGDAHAFLVEGDTQFSHYLGHFGRGDPQAPGARDAAFKAFGDGSVSLKACLDKKDPPSKH